MVEHYHGNHSLPVYEHPTKGYNGERIAQILCDPTLDEESLCSTHPTSVENNVSFVVDLSKLQDRNDVRSDDLGAWKCTGTHVLTFAVKCSNDGCVVVNQKSPGAIIINVRRQYHVHGTDGDLHRMIAFIESVQKGKLTLISSYILLCVIYR